MYTNSVLGEKTWKLFCWNEISCQEGLFEDTVVRVFFYLACLQSILQMLSIYTNFNIWPWSATFTLDIPKQMFEMAHLLGMENIFAISYLSQSVNIGAMLRTRPDIN